MKLFRYLRLYKTHRAARKFYNSYEHLTRDIQFHPQMNVRLDVYSPPEAGPYPVLVFVHGGGWKRFNKELFSLAAVKLLPEKMMMVIPDHTLHPEAGYEQMVHEVAAAVSWTLDNVERYGGDPERIVVAGHSSGGHLVSLATMDHRFLSTYGHTNDNIRGILLISSGHDLEAQYTYEQSKGKNGSTELMETIVGITGGVEKFPIAEKRAQLVVDIAEFVHGVTQNPPNTMVAHLGSADKPRRRAGGTKGGNGACAKRRANVQ